MSHARFPQVHIGVENTYSLGKQRTYIGDAYTAYTAHTATHHAFTVDLSYVHQHPHMNVLVALIS